MASMWEAEPTPPTYMQESESGTPDSYTGRYCLAAHTQRSRVLHLQRACSKEDPVPPTNMEEGGSYSPDSNVGKRILFS